MTLRWSIPALMLVLVSVTAVDAAPVILANGAPTITLSRGAGFQGSTPMTIAYHPGFDQYYGGNGGNPGFSGFVWDAAGNLIQTITPSNVDLRGINYNPNTSAIEVVTFNAVGGGSPAGLVTMGLDGAGLFTGTNANTLGALPGLNGDQTMPSYNPDTDELYSRSNSNVINRVDRADGSLLGTINLDLAPAGTPPLQGEFAGFDSFFDVFVTLDITDLANPRALVHDLSGSFLGASQLTGFDPTQDRFNAGYTNGQVFIFDSSINAYRGYRIFEDVVAVPEPSTIILAGFAGLALLVIRRRRARA